MGKAPGMCVTVVVCAVHEVGMEVTSVTANPDTHKMLLQRHIVTFIYQHCYVIVVAARARWWRVFMAVRGAVCCPCPVAACHVQQRTEPRKRAAKRAWFREVRGGRWYVERCAAAGAVNQVCFSFVLRGSEPVQQA